MKIKFTKSSIHRLLSIARQTRETQNVSSECFRIWDNAAIRSNLSVEKKEEISEWKSETRENCDRISPVCRYCPRDCEASRFVAKCNRCQRELSIFTEQSEKRWREETSQTHGVALVDELRGIADRTAPSHTTSRIAHRASPRCLTISPKSITASRQPTIHNAFQYKILYIHLIIKKYI